MLKVFWTLRLGWTIPGRLERERQPENSPKGDQDPPQTVIKIIPLFGAHDRCPEKKEADTRKIIPSIRYANQKETPDQVFPVRGLLIIGSSVRQWRKMHHATFHKDPYR